MQEIFHVSNLFLRELKLSGRKQEVELYVLLIASKADVVGGDGVQEEPIKAWQVSVHLKHTQTDTEQEDVRGLQFYCNLGDQQRYHGEGVTTRLLSDVGERRL